MPEYRPTKKERQVIYERAFGCCEYCQSHDRWATQGFVLEHIIPRSKQGQSILSNLAFACPGCNNHKYNFTEATDPLTQKLAPLFHPRNQIWLEHFTWNEDFTKMVGLTPTGRASVMRIKLNRPRLINRRQAFYLLGLHPPIHTLTKS